MSTTHASARLATTRLATSPTGTATSGRTAPRRTAARRVAALASVLLAATTLIAGCGSSGPEAIAATDRPAAKATPSPADAADTDAVEAPPSSDTAPDEDGQAPASQPAYVVRSDHDLVVHEAPDTTAPSRTLAARTDFGSPLALLVTGARDGWLEVLVPGRPTGATAWVERGDLEVREVTTELRVDLAARTLTLYDGGEVVLTTPIAIGSPEAPTPTGRFSITDKLASPNPAGAYGPFAIGLSGRSEVLTDFAGGDGQIGIHGTNDPASIGQAVSHGCIRVPNDVIERLNEVLPLGTPVVVD